MLKRIAVLSILVFIIVITGVFAQTELPEVDPLSVSGDIIAAGSSTVFPLSEHMANLFADEGYADNITIDSIGSGAGFERFCVSAESDISNASRRIRESEIESCRENGREPIEFRVGTDALAVTVNVGNEFVANLTLHELALVFSDPRDEEGTVIAARTWSDINPEWLSEPIERFIPGTDSGTYDYFVEAIFEELYDEQEESGEYADPFIASDFDLTEDDPSTEDDENGEARDASINRPILSAGNTQLSEDDNVLVQGIEGSKYAIGFFGIAYYQENSDILNILNVNDVEPNEATAEDNSYPLSRPLFFYSDAGIMQAKPQVAEFINFFLTNVNNEIVEVGYFPASTETLDAARQAWLDAITMGE